MCVIIIHVYNHLQKIEQKGMFFNHDFGYSFPLFSSLLKKREEEKENEVAKIVINSHAFLLDPSKIEIYIIIIVIVALHFDPVRSIS